MASCQPSPAADLLSSIPTLTPFIKTINGSIAACWNVGGAGGKADGLLGGDRGCRYTDYCDEGLMTKPLEHADPPTPLIGKFLLKAMVKANR